LAGIKQIAEIEGNVVVWDGKLDTSLLDFLYSLACPSRYWSWLCNLCRFYTFYWPINALNCI